jgi:hypothetical protein
MAWLKARHRRDGSPYLCVFFGELSHGTGKRHRRLRVTIAKTAL